MLALTLEEIPQHDTGRIRMGSGEQLGYNATGQTIPARHSVGVRAEEGELRIVADLGAVR